MLNHRNYLYLKDNRESLDTVVHVSELESSQEKVFAAAGGKPASISGTSADRDLNNPFIESLSASVAPATNTDETMGRAMAAEESAAAGDDWRDGHDVSFPESDLDSSEHRQRISEKVGCV